MNPHSRHCFVILVHHADAAHTRRAVDELLAGSLRPTRVIVVDHGPVPYGEAGHDRVSVIRPEHNGGYGAGINVGLGVLLVQGAERNDIVVGMNDTVHVYPDTLAELLAWFTNHPEPALVGGVVEERGEVVYGGGYVSRWTGRAHLCPDRDVWDRRGEYIHGAFFAAPYVVLIANHGWPEDYFLYGEDVLFSWQVQRAGVGLYVAADVRVRHVADGSPQYRDQHLYYLVRNGALFMEHETAWPIRVLWWGWNRGRRVYHTLRRGQQARVVQRALTDATRGVTGRKA